MRTNDDDIYIHSTSKRWYNFAHYIYVSVIYIQ